MPEKPSTILNTLVSDGGRGMGSEPYRGEGGLASGGEYHNALEPFLGPPTKAIDIEPHMRFPHEAWFLPDAYAGRNDYIRETIVQMVINYNAFMTREILPWREQNNPNIAWDSIKFDKTLIDMEPEQGIPRYVTVEREAHTDYMVRRGLALIVNHGFAATPGGQKDFMYKVATIAGAVQETCDQAGVIAILRAKNEYRCKIVEDMKSASDAHDLFHHELWRWGIIQHTERGWYHMDAEAQHVMRCENIQPDTWIVPPRMTSFAAMGQMAETEVWRAGESTARGNLLRGEDNFATFRGKSVYEIKPYQLDVDGRVVDPLNRSRMIGDFFVVPCFDIARDGDGPQYPRYGKGRTQVYCCETDTFETFSWKDVINRCKFDEVDIGPVDGVFNDDKKDLSALLQYIPDDQDNTTRGRAMELIRALCINRCIQKNDHDANRDHGIKGDADELSAFAEKCRKHLPFLAPILKEHATKDADKHNATAPKASGSTFLQASGKSASRYGPNASAAHFDAAKALNNAMYHGIQKKYNLGAQEHPENPSVAARTYAKTACAAGMTAAEASKAMLDAMHEHIAQHIDSEAKYVTPSDLTESPMEDIHDSYIMGEVHMGPLDAAVNAAAPLVIRAHQSGALAHKGSKTPSNSSKYKSDSKDQRASNFPDDDTGRSGNIGNIIQKAVSTSGLTEAAAAFDLLCVRPFRQYTMGTGVLCKKGNELGNTFRGWADFQLTDNIIAKTHIGHFTFWHASVVTNPKCLFLAEDIFCTNYEVGEGRDILPWSQVSNFREDPIGTMRAHNASIIVLPVPVGAISPTDHRLCTQNPISLTGALDPNVRQLTGRQDACRVHIGDYEINGATHATLVELNAMYEAKVAHLLQAANTVGTDIIEAFLDKNPRPPNASLYTGSNGCGGQVLSDIYDAIWGFSGMNHDVDYQNSGTFETSARLINTMCFHTMQKFQNPHNLRWEVTNLNTGHFGENGIYEGVKKIRCGFIDYFKEMNYQKAMAMGGQNL